MTLNPDKECTYEHTHKLKQAKLTLTTAILLTKDQRTICGEKNGILGNRVIKEKEKAKD